MSTIKLKGQVTSDRQLVVKLPDDIAPGLVEVIIVQESHAEAPKNQTPRKLTHPAFGIWAKRKDISDAALFATRLRQQIEHKEDGRN